MAPKAAEKKAVPKKAVAYVQKQIDSSRYLRKQEYLEPINEIPVRQLTGVIANVDNIYPEWSIAAQNWSDNQDSEEYVRYPTELKFQDLQSIRTSLNLEPPESKVKSKGDSRKSKDTSTEIQLELLVDDEGRKLPRVIFRDDGGIYRYDQQMLFKRTHSSEQVDRKSLQDRLLQNISDSEQGSEDAVRRTELQLVYDEAVAERDVKLEKPGGPEIDHNMCAVFRIVSEFAMRSSGVDKAEGDKGACKVLWNSIYPQLPSGKPVYNASGKYAVKLFLAGKWRKIIVTDTIPITADGPAIASSQESLELWPVLLSKAVYSVYTACGYYNSMPTLQETHSGRKEHISASISNTHKTSFFIGFAVHLLTGWQPSVPRSVADTIDLDIQRARGLLQEITFGGAPNILYSDIPAVEPPTVRLGGGARGSDIVLGDLTKCHTKKHFKEEYSLRFAERARVVGEIEVREELTRRLSEAFSSPFSEGYLLCFQAPSSSSSSSAVPVDSNPASSPVISVPILGMCLGPESSKDSDSKRGSGKESDAKDLKQFLLDDGQEDSDFALLNSVKLLIKWHTAPAVPIPVDPGKEPLPADITSLLQGINDPLPPCTVIESQWVSLRELAARQAYIIGIDTNNRLPHQALFNWHWLPLAVEKGVEKAPKPPKGRAPEVLRNPSVLCGDPGVAPPMLLSLDTQHFFATATTTAVAAATAVAAGPSRDPVTAPVTAVTTPRTTVTTPRLPGDGEGFGPSIPGSPPRLLTPIDGGALSAYLSISLSVHADLVLPDVVDGTTSLPLSLSPRVPQSTGKRPQTMTSTASSPVFTGESKKGLAPTSPCPAEDPTSGGGSSVLPSDVTIVLQELRTDHKEPLVMRIELSPAAKIPITRTTFHIPCERIEKTGKLVFWVRIFSKTSMHLRVACAVPVVIGDVEDVWGELGGSVLVREGEAAPSRANTEQLLFRVPLQICPLESTERMGVLLEGVGSGAGGDAFELNPLPGAGVVGSGGRCIEDRQGNFVTAFLHIPDRKAARYVSILLGASRGETVTLPRIDGNYFLLSGPPSCLKTLIGRCFVGDAHNRPASSALLSAFKWKLVVISWVPLEAPSPASLSPSIVRGLQQRYRGVYRPNKKLILFRDVYSLDPLSFPLALRITTLPLRSTSLVVETLASSSSGSGRGATGSTGPSEGDACLNIAEDVSIIVRLYRKSDRLLVSESRACGVLQLYQIALEGLLLPQDAAPVSAPDTPTKPRKAPSKKAGDLKTALGKKGSQGDEVEFILECSLDDTAMVVPPHWHSRLPFSFSIDASDVSTAGSQAICRKGKDGSDEKLAQVVPTVSSYGPSVSLPQFQWQVDVLAGNVGEVSHDTFDLERQVEWKNGWEEASQGRAERAAAAMAYVMEKRVQKSAVLLAMEPEHEPYIVQGGGGQGTAVPPGSLSTDKLVDLLALALEREEQRPILAEREVRLLGLPEYKEHKEDWRGTAPYRIEPSALEIQKAVRAERKETSEADTRRMCAMMLDLNELLRNEAASRVQVLAAQAAAGQAAIALQWEAREAFRADSLLKAQAFKVQSEKVAADSAALAAAELALIDTKDRRTQRAKASTPTSKRQSLS